MVTHDKAESIQTNPAFANVFMSINARAACGFGIVEVNSNEPFPANHAIELAQRLSCRMFAADVVTRSEKMCGVKADTNAFWLAHIGDDESEMLEPMTDA